MMQIKFGSLMVLLCAQAALIASVDGAVTAELPLHPFDLGNRFFILGKYAEAIAAYSQAVESDPETQFADTAVFQIARSYKALGNWFKAESVFKKISESFPDSPWCDDALFELGNHYAHMTNKQSNKQAIAFYKEILTKYPHGDQIEQAMIELALSSMLIGEFAETEKYLKQVIEKSTNPELLPRALYLLGQFYSNPNNKQQQIEKAIELFDKLVSEYQDFKDLPAVYYALGTCHQTLGNNDLALKNYNKVVVHYPASVFAIYAQYGIADCYKQKQDFPRANQAIDDLKKNWVVQLPDYATNAPSQQSAKENSEKLKISADKSNKDIEEFTGNVVIKLNDISVKADLARVDLKQYLIEARGSASISKEKTAFITGNVLLFDLKTYTVLAKGAATLRQQKDGKNLMQQSKALRYNLATDEFELLPEGVRIESSQQ